MASARCAEVKVVYTCEERMITWANQPDMLQLAMPMSDAEHANFLHAIPSLYWLVVAGARAAGPVAGRFYVRDHAQGD